MASVSEKYVFVPKTVVRARKAAALALAARMKIRAEDKIRIVADFFASLATAEAGDREKELVSGFVSSDCPER
jgi:hypothetical protein